MRLLHTHDLYFKEFNGRNIPEYAILSHTWSTDHEEISFQDLSITVSDRQFREAFHSMQSGFTSLAKTVAQDASTCESLVKILQFCYLARKEGTSWAWVDSCCINKQSSAELSESINSMYKWYRRAQFCCAYLVDVEYVYGPGEEPHEQPSSRSPWENRNSQFPRDGSISVEEDAGSFPEIRSSRWFTRGFTLQELLAPVEVKFFDRHWNFIGDRVKLAVEISTITGIRLPVLGSANPTEVIRRCSVAERMSWAANRETTRLEDIAYCLIGIFGINMSLLYGEGDNAFFRLQKKIIKTTNDETIFAWDPSRVKSYGDFHGLLARHPKAFVGLQDCVPLNMNCDPVSITSRGVGFPIFNHKHLVQNTLRTTLPLNCRRDSQIMGIFLAKLGGVWYRVSELNSSDNGLCELGQNSSIPMFLPESSYRESLYVSMTPSLNPTSDYGVGLNRDINMNGDLDARHIDADDFELKQDDMSSIHIAIRFTTHLMPWRSLLRSVDRSTALSIKASYPEITQYRGKQDQPVELTDTGKEVIWGPVTIDRSVPEPRISPASSPTLSPAVSPVVSPAVSPLAGSPVGTPTLAITASPGMSKLLKEWVVAIREGLVS